MKWFSCCQVGHLPSLSFREVTITGLLVICLPTLFSQPFHVLCTREKAQRFSLCTVNFKVFFLSHKFSSLWLWRSLVTWLLPFFSLLELVWEQMLYFIRIEEFGFILNGSRSQMLWWFWKEIFERNSILGHWYFVCLWGYIVILQGSTLRKKIFWCEKSKLFIPKMLKLDVSVFLTFSPLFFFWNTVMILQNILCLISFGLVEVASVKAFSGCCFLFLQGI